MIQFDYTLFNVLIGTTLVGVAAGTVGCFVFLQRQSLFGDTIAHATLPGLAGMFLFTAQKHSFWLLAGATVSSLCAALLISIINSKSHLKKDTTLGIVLSTTFGLGTMLLSIIQTYPTAHKAGINKFLLGNASTLLHSDITIIAYTTLLTLLTIATCWKECKLFVFNQEFATSIGIRTTLIQIILTTVTVLTIIVGLQTVGVVLISALLIAPAAAAYQWTQHLSSMVLLSCLFSCCATISGTLLSGSLAHVPTGPTIVIIATMITLLSIFFAPNHSVFATYIKRRKQIKKINAHTMLSHFMLFNESKTDPFHAHDIKALQAIGKKSTNETLHYLQQQQLIEMTHKNFWRLTPKGLNVAQNLRCSL